MSDYKINYFIQKLEKINVVLDDHQINQFMKYYELLIEWNSFMNLTSITEYEDVVNKHFIDSILLVKSYDVSKNVNIIDVGTGAGFPGIPLKIAFPNLNITLLDSLQKRIKFLDEVILQLDLKNINTIHGRAEDYTKPNKLREEYDLVVSRAVANLATLSEYCLPFVKVGGKFISYKSDKLLVELEDAKKAIYLLGGEISKQVDFILPDSDIYRNLVVINKIRSTPKRFPRKPGLASKEPIK